MKNDKKPKIRFKGFDDDWEQRKLSEVVKEIKRTDETSSAPVMMITAENGFINQSERYSTNNAGQSLKKYILLEKGELAYNHGASKLRPFGSCFSLTTEEKARIPFVYHCFSSGSENAEFMSIELNGKAVESQLRRIVSSGARMDGLLNISFQEYTSIPILLPEKAEQDKIADYFCSLDHLITLHQRKCDKLQKTKKSMLEKMFPQNEAKKPEIRFKGFNDDWEQCKLSDIADKVTEKNAGLQYIETLTNSAEFGIISQRDFFDHDISKMASLDGYYVVRNEDFVYNPRISVTAPVGPINRNKLGRTGVMSPLYTVFRPHDIDTTYLEHFFKSNYWHSFMNFNGDSGARSDRFSIKDNVFFEMSIPTPDIEEQRRIGRYLTNFDHLITLHQRELEKMKYIKKSMLEKMFVQENRIIH
ncbi:restriction endonuclease subunit S [Eubacterium segne]|nr:restriction endonuclease subunit S [Eubacterium segne]